MILYRGYLMALVEIRRIDPIRVQHYAYPSFILLLICFRNRRKHSSKMKRKPSLLYCLYIK